MHALQPRGDAACGVVGRDIQAALDAWRGQKGMLKGNRLGSRAEEGERPVPESAFPASPVPE